MLVVAQAEKKEAEAKTPAGTKSTDDSDDEDDDGYDTEDNDKEDTPNEKLMQPGEEDDEKDEL